LHDNASPLTAAYTVKTIQQNNSTRGDNRSMLQTFKHGMTSVPGAIQVRIKHGESV